MKNCGNLQPFSKRWLKACLITERAQERKTMGPIEVLYKNAKCLDEVLEYLKTIEFHYCICGEEYKGRGLIAPPVLKSIIKHTSGSISAISQRVLLLV